MSATKSAAANGHAPLTAPVARRRKSSLMGKSIERAGVTGPSLSTGIAQEYTAEGLSPSDSKRTKSRRAGQKSGFWHSYRRFALTNTWSIPLIPILVLLAIYAANPTESNPVSRFIWLSYRQEKPLTYFGGSKEYVQYGKGPWDIAFVSFYTLVLSFTREFIMGRLLQPLAKIGGIRTKGKQMRFMEQMYTAVYFGCMGPVGLWVMRQTPVWYFNTTGMYEGFPHRTHTAEFKFYYLFQAAYWAQQALVMLLGLEKPRKDFYELVAHHIVTLALIGLSYRFHFTYMGIAVYITHDVSDFFLAVSKSLHYLDVDAVAPAFAMSILAWTYCRHYLNLKILWSILTEFKTVGPFVLNWETQQYKCWISQVITFALLASLQSLNLFWLYCLLRSAYKFVVYNTRKDDRSDSEESEPETENEKPLATGIDSGNVRARK